MLTTAQAETIYKLRMNYYEAGANFYPDDAFPRRNNQDNGHRRTLTGLAKKGILDYGPEGRGQLTVTQATIDAYDAWYAKRGFNVDTTEWRYS